MSEATFLQTMTAFDETQERFLTGIAPMVPQVTATPSPSIRPRTHETWPMLDSAARYGLTGEVVQLFEPHTEADPVALLVSFLSEVGAMVGRAPHLILDGGYHPLLFWPVLVGKSSKSRKGTADKRIDALCQLVDETWTRGEC